MALKLAKATEPEGGTVLRSVGDPPNGILGITHNPDGPTWVIDGAVETGAPPAAEEVGSIVVEGRTLTEAAAAAQTEIAIAEVVEAIPDVEAAIGLMQYASAQLVATTQRFAPMLWYEKAEQAVEFALANREALVDAGYLTIDWGKGG